MAKRKLLITGASGFIAAQLLPVFKQRYELTLLDIKNRDRHGNKVAGVVKANLCGGRFARHRKYFDGIDTVVHLGYHRTGTRDFPDEWPNVKMTYLVLRLAHDCNVRRVVVASSNHATDWYEDLWRNGELKFAPNISPRSDNFYGWAKASSEHLGFVFATGFYGRKLENIHLRIGAPREIDYQNYAAADKARLERDLGAYLSPRDLQQLFIKSVEAVSIDNEHGVPWQVFYGVSDNRRRFWSISDGRDVIGYVPEDDSEIKFADSVSALVAK